MKIIRNKKIFILGILCIIVFIFSLVASIHFKTLDMIFVMVSMVTCGCIQLGTSVSPCFLAEKSINNAEDERDVYIALKSASVASRIMFYCIGIASLIFGVLHMLSENIVFAIISISLCSCLLLFSIVYFFVNIFYEKRG